MSQHSYILKESERHLLVVALHVARDGYAACVKQALEVRDSPIAERFSRQYEDAERLAELIDKARTVIILP